MTPCCGAFHTRVQHPITWRTPQEAKTAECYEPAEHAKATPGPGYRFRYERYRGIDSHASYQELGEAIPSCPALEWIWHHRNFVHPPWVCRHGLDHVAATPSSQHGVQCATARTGTKAMGHAPSNILFNKVIAASEAACIRRLSITRDLPLVSQ